MARNRKHQSVVNRFGPALKAFMLCLLIGGAGVGYVWQKNQIDELGKQILKRERRLAELIDQNEKWKKQLGEMRSRTWILAHLKDPTLGPPQPSQVWKLTEPSRDSSPARSPEQQLAAHAAQSPILP
jgi:hypothetical protein